MAPTLGNFNLDFGQDPYGQLPGQIIQRPDGTSFVVPPGLVAQGVQPQQPGQLPMAAIPPFNPGKVNINDPNSVMGLSTEAAKEKYNAQAQALTTGAAAQNNALDQREALNRQDMSQTEDIYKTHKENAQKISDEADQITARVQQWANTNVDPNAVTARMDTWQKLMLGISLAAGGFLAPDHGGQNIALQSLNTIIDRDVAAQKDKLSRQGKGLEFMSENNRLKAKDEDADFKTALEHKAQMLALANKQIDLELTRVTSPSQQAALSNLKAGATEELAKTALEISKMGSAERVARISAGPHYAQVAEEKRQFNETLPLKTFEAGEKARHDVAGEAAKGAGALEPIYDPNTGAQIAAVRKDEAKDATAIVRGYGTVKHQIEVVKQKLAALSDMDRHPSFGMEAFKSSAMKDAESSAQTLKDQALALVRAIGDKGNMGKQLMEGMEKKINTNFGWTGSTDPARFDAMSEDIDNLLRESLNSMGAGQGAGNTVVQGASSSGGASGVTATQTSMGTKFSF